MSVDWTNFDPGKHAGGSDDPIPPGDYILTVKSFRRQVRNQKRQIDFIIVPLLDADLNRVSAGQFAPLWETVTLTQAAAFRLANLLEAIRVQPPINVTSDSSLAGAVRWKPFKARIGKDVYNGKARAKLDKYLPLSEREAKAFAEVLEDFQVDSQLSQAGGGGSD